MWCQYLSNILCKEINSYQKKSHAFDGTSNLRFGKEFRPAGYGGLSTSISRRTGLTCALPLSFGFLSSAPEPEWSWSERGGN